MFNKIQRGNPPLTSNQIKRVSQFSCRLKTWTCIFKIESHKCLLPYCTLPASWALYQSSGKLLLQSSPLSNLRASAAMNHMADLSPSRLCTSATVIYQRQRARWRERWKMCPYDAVRSIWILLASAIRLHLPPVTLSPTSPSRSFSRPWVHSTRRNWITPLSFGYYFIYSALHIWTVQKTNFWSKQD